MATWLFQTIDPERVAAIRTGQVERWCVRRYRSAMQPGDSVFIWLGGAPNVRGVHGWGRLVSPVCVAPDGTTHHVDVCYEQRRTPFIAATTLRKHPVLRGLAILHAPRATNFPLSTAEAAALSEMIEIIQKQEY